MANAVVRHPSPVARVVSLCQKGVGFRTALVAFYKCNLTTWNVGTLSFLGHVMDNMQIKLISTSYREVVRVM